MAALFTHQHDKAAVQQSDMAEGLGLLLLLSSSILLLLLPGLIDPVQTFAKWKKGME